MLEDLSSIFLGNLSWSLGLTEADRKPPTAPAPVVCWVTVVSSMLPAIRMLSRGRYLLRKFPVLIRLCGDEDRWSGYSREPRPRELLPRLGTSGVTGKNPSSLAGPS